MHRRRWLHGSGCLRQHCGQEELAQGSLQAWIYELFTHVRFQSMVIGPCGANIRKICHEAEVIAFLFTLSASSHLLT